MNFNPEDYAPGKPVSGAMLEGLIRDHGHKIIMMLMLRLGLSETTIGEDDLKALDVVPGVPALYVKSMPDGILLQIGEYHER